MKNTISYILFVLFISSTVQAQHNYQVGNLQVNNITYKCTMGGNRWFIKNINNSLTNNAPTHSNVDCGEANFKNAEWVKIENVFRQVFPSLRRGQFDNREHIYVNIFADATGKIKEVTFDFNTTCPVTPQELYNLEVGLKALPPLQYAYPADCSGVNYRITGSPIYIHQL